MAILRVVGGELVLDDPDAVAMIKAVAKHNCKNTLTMSADRVKHFVGRMGILGKSPAEVVIVLCNVDDPNGGILAGILMPGTDWQPIRDSGQVPFARGLADRPGMQHIVDNLDDEAGAKLRAMVGVAVVVMDHGVVEVFAAEDAQ